MRWQKPVPGLTMTETLKLGPVRYSPGHQLLGCVWGGGKKLLFVVSFIVFWGWRYSLLMMSKQSLKKVKYLGPDSTVRK